MAINKERLKSAILNSASAGAWHKEWNMNGTQDHPSGDLLYGLEAIGKHLGLGARQVQYLHDKGELPTFKKLRTVCATRSGLAAHFAEQQAVTRNPDA